MNKPDSPITHLSAAELDDELDATMRSRFAPPRAAHKLESRSLVIPAEEPAETSGDHDDQATHLRRLMQALEAERDGDLPSFPSDRPRWVGSSLVSPDEARVHAPHREEGARRLPEPQDQPSRVSGRSSGLRPAVGARVIAVASGKGGVGKTNVAVNLAVALSQRGVRVVLVDADLGTANADVLCGLMPTARLDHVVTPLPMHDGARQTLEQIAVTAPGGFQLIPGSAGIARMADLAEDQQRRLIDDLEELESRFDVIIIDTAAGVGRSVLDFVRIADDAIVVSTPEPTSLADAYALVKCLFASERRRGAATGAADAQMPRVGLIVNQVVSAHEGRCVHERLRGVARRFLGVEIQLVGTIAQDLRVGEAVRARLPYVLHSPRGEATHDTREIAASIAQELGLGAPNGSQLIVARPSRFARWLGRGKVRE